MASSAPVTVIITDSAAPRDAVRALMQVVKTCEQDTEVVLASYRPIPLSATLARRVRRLRAATPAALDEAVGVELARERVVVVCSSTASLAPGWSAAVRERCASHPHVISTAYGREGGLLVSPATAEPSGARVMWDAADVVRLRGADRRTPRSSLSAVMIVKDEEDVLDECLTALAPFVDEIVVYDTGSTDATCDIARRHGARLVEGYWDDHFGDARNRALAHAGGDWILHVDADEVVSGDAGQLRTRLDVENRDQLHVKIVSTSFVGGTTGVQTSPIRIFRREGYAWVGALHEYPAPLDPARRPTASATPAPLLLTHSGYHAETIEARSKSSRNLALAERELARSGDDPALRAELLSNYGRTLVVDDQIDAALEVFDELRRTSGGVSPIVAGGRSAVEILLARGESERVLEWADVMQACGESAGNVAVLRARARLVAGDADAAEAALAVVRESGRGGRDPWGAPFDAARVTSVLVGIAVERGDFAAAIDHSLVLAADAPEQVDLAGLVQACLQSGRPVIDVVRAAAADLLARSLVEAATYPLDVALPWLEAFVAVHPTDPRPVAAANLIAASGGWQVALAWSLRARAMGQELTALRVLGEADAAPALDRAIAWLLLDGGFGAADAAGRLSRSIATLTPAECAQVQGLAAHLGATLVIDRAA